VREVMILSPQEYKLYMVHGKDFPNSGISILTMKKFRSDLQFSKRWLKHEKVGPWFQIPTEIKQLNNGSAFVLADHEVVYKYRPAPVGRCRKEKKQVRNIC
jgi:hypothetical protein